MSNSSFSIAGANYPNEGNPGVTAVAGTLGQINVTNPTTEPVLSLDPSIMAAITEINTAPILGANAFINGHHLIWQRGTTFSLPGGTTQYTADRWQVAVGGTDTVTISQVSDGNTGFLLKAQRVANGANPGQILIGQSLLRSRSTPLIGQNLNLQFKAMSGNNFTSANHQITVLIIGGTNTQSVSSINPGFTSPVTILTQVIPLNSSLTSYSFPLVIPPGINQIALEVFWTPIGVAGADDSVTCGKFYLGEGEGEAQVPDFEQTLNQCLPYFRSSYPYGTPPGTPAILSGMWVTNWQGALPSNYALSGPVWSPPMRAVPTVKTFNYGNTAANALSAADNSVNYGANSGLAYNTLDQSGFDVQNASGAAINAVFGGFKLHYQCDSEL